MNRTYSELCTLPTFEERFEYLRLGGGVGRATFGFDRHINQKFYSSYEWQRIRRRVINRDLGCDLGVPGYDIPVEPLIHHMNPIDVHDILHREEYVLDPEFLILTSHNTHNGIHFGAVRLIPRVVLERQPGDTTPW